MNRKREITVLFLSSLVVMSICLNYARATTQNVLPTGKSQPTIEIPHFPSRVHAFIWRNWESVKAERMAKVLGTTPEKVSEIGQSMGLFPPVKLRSDFQQRAYCSIIRRNWHLLPYDQLLTLLDWDAEKLAFTLREDDFLWIKLGNMKPTCPPLHYTDPDEVTKKRCEEIKQVVSSYFAEEFTKPSQPRFDFIETLCAVDKVKQFTVSPDISNQEPIRFIYSYFSVYGDPLSDPQLDPYPKGLLQKLAANGVNGVWLHTVLRQLAPSSIFPEFGEGSEVRLETLRAMVERASRYGIKVYLYMNEPRAMPASFFKDREAMKGVPAPFAILSESSFVAPQNGEELAYYSMCTCAPQVRQWLEDSLCYVFKEVPGLGGIFTISATENPTHCWSHYKGNECPRCSKRSAAEVVAEVNSTIAKGVWRGNPEAKVIVWDWHWQEEWVEDAINGLQEGTYFMSVSEFDVPIKRGGISNIVNEYSMSAVGPGPLALRHWSFAKARGLNLMAKVQVNNTWELSTVPFIPAMNLVAQHCRNLANAGVNNLMLSWSLGCYPSMNLRLAAQFSGQPLPTVEQALKNVAMERYGADAADDVLAAWSRFSEAFAEYPFDIFCVYCNPMQYGPANLLYSEPTGYEATMSAFPYDDVDGWRAMYPAEVYAEQFAKMASGWQTGIPVFENALSKTLTPQQKTNVSEDLCIAKAVGLYFKSVANQVRFTLARDALLQKSANPLEREKSIAVIKTTAADEVTLAKQFFILARQDSRIGFEAANQYFFYPLDLVEKVIDCRYILDNWLDTQSQEITGG